MENERAMERSRLLVLSLSEASLLVPVVVVVKPDVKRSWELRGLGAHFRPDVLERLPCEGVLGVMNVRAAVFPVIAAHPIVALVEVEQVPVPVGARIKEMSNEEASFTKLLISLPNRLECEARRLAYTCPGECIQLVLRRIQGTGGDLPCVRCIGIGTKGIHLCCKDDSDQSL